MTDLAKILKKSCPLTVDMTFTVVNFSDVPLVLHVSPSQGRDAS